MESADTRQTFVQAAIACADLCFPGSVVAYHEVSADTVACSSHESRDPRVDDDMVRAWKLHVLSSPVVKYYLAGGTDPIVATQDLMGDVALRRTALYADCWKPLGVKYQIGLRLWSGGWVSGLSIKRDRRFTEAESATARTLYSFFFRSYQRLLVADMNRSERVELLFDQDYRQVSSSSGWMRLLGGTNAISIVDRIKSRLQTLDASRAHQSTVFSVQDVECCTQQLAGRLFKVSLRIPQSMLVEPLAKLTAREREILTWISKGKRDAEIGIILEISTKTVNNLRVPGSR